MQPVLVDSPPLAHRHVASTGRKTGSETKSANTNGNAKVASLGWKIVNTWIKGMPELIKVYFRSVASKHYGGKLLLLRLCRCWFLKLALQQSPCPPRIVGVRKHRVLVLGSIKHVHGGQNTVALMQHTQRTVRVGSQHKALTRRHVDYLKAVWVQNPRPRRHCCLESNHQIPVRLMDISARQSHMFPVSSIGQERQQSTQNATAIRCQQSLQSCHTLSAMLLLHIHLPTLEGGSDST